MIPMNLSKAQSSKPSFTPAPVNMVQGKYACGGSVGLSGECAECLKKKSVRASAFKIQPKLKISQPGDKYEQEADQVANEVMKIPEPRVQRQSKPEEKEEEHVLVKPRLVNKMAQKKRSNNIEYTAPNSSAVHDGIESIGHSIDPVTRSFMESRFGHNFRQVKIHTDKQANASAQSVKARAYTLGQDIVFGEGQYSPGTRSGRQLLAHELTHVTQQSDMSECVIRRKEIDDCRDCSHLKDTTTDINEFVNLGLKAARSDTNLDEAAASAEGRQPKHLVVFVFERLGKQVSLGTTPLDHWAEHLDEGMAERQRESTTKFKGAGLPGGSASLARLMRIGNLCIGSDKLGHMFENGFFAFSASEPIAGGAGGFKAAVKQGEEEEKGLFGLKTTGVFSNADIAANIAGVAFYKDLVENEKMIFSIVKYIRPNWNECNNPNFYSEDVAKSVWTNLFKNRIWGGTVTIDGVINKVSVEFRRITTVENKLKDKSASLKIYGEYKYSGPNDLITGNINGIGKLVTSIEGTTAPMGISLLGDLAAFGGVKILFEWNEDTLTGKGMWSSKGESSLQGTWGIGRSVDSTGKWKLKSGEDPVVLKKTPAEEHKEAREIEIALKKKEILQRWVKRVAQKELNPKKLTRLRANRARLVFVLEKHGKLDISLDLSLRKKLQRFIEEKNKTVEFTDLRPIEIVGSSHIEG